VNLNNRGGNGHDDLVGGHNVRTLSDANDTISGDDGDDVLVGDNGIIIRTVLAVSLCGRRFPLVNDWLYYAKAPVTSGSIREVQLFGVMDGISSNDILSGNNGDDRVFGGRGNDTLYGGNGDDELIGGLDNDIIFGNDGHDLIFGDEAMTRKWISSFINITSFDSSSGSKWEYAVLTEDVCNVVDMVSINPSRIAKGVWPSADFWLNGDMIALGVLQSFDGRRRLVNGSWDAYAISFQYEPTSSDDDNIKGGNGNDFIVGQRGDDLIQGNDDNDVLIGDYSHSLSSSLNGTNHPLVINAMRLINQTGGSLLIDIPSDDGILILTAPLVVPRELGQPLPLLGTYAIGSMVSSQLDWFERHINGYNKFLTISSQPQSVFSIITSMVGSILHNNAAVYGNDHLSGGDGDDTIIGDVLISQGWLSSFSANSLIQDARMRSIEMTDSVTLRLSLLAQSVDQVKRLNVLNNVPNQICNASTINVGNDIISGMFCCSCFWRPIFMP
jgi:Ca2+-binding RTX toxin-like protein